ncbi:YceI family protein [Maricaulis sp.]|uniref:YceI family protein n=1 Tax=Maricaulis sp. TaxID=1486257 RepID=UPI0026306D32|nr:YceI family protein [Maricaulis sp.]
MRTLLIPVLASLSLVAACSQAADDAPASDWSVNTEASMLSFVSTKLGDIDEEHEIPGLSGEIAADGAFSIEIALDTHESFIDIRNERMAEHLFQTAQYPVATASGQLEMRQFMSLALGASRTISLPFQLGMVGQSIELRAQVEVMRVSENLVRVTTVEPVTVEAADLGLVDGINTLRELAGLDSIDTDVPVSFTLEFAR